MGAEKRLSNAKIRKCHTGKHFDGGGLIFVKAEESSKWVFRFTRFGKTRDMGLGAYPATSLAQARAEHAKCRALLYQGVDPIEHRLRKTLRQQNQKTLAEIAKGLQRMSEALEAASE